MIWTITVGRTDVNLKATHTQITEGKQHPVDLWAFK